MGGGLPSALPEPWTLLMQQPQEGLSAGNPETAGVSVEAGVAFCTLPRPAVGGQAAQGGCGPQWLRQGPGEEQGVGEGPGEVAGGPSGGGQTLGLDADRRRRRGGHSAGGALLTQAAAAAGERGQEGQREKNDEKSYRSWGSAGPL